MQQYFELLGSFCTHNGHAIEVIQTTIFNNISGLLPTVQKNTGAKWELVIHQRVKTPGKHYRDWDLQPLSLGHEYEHVEFLEAVLHAVAGIAFGRHHHSRGGPARCAAIRP